MKLFNCYIILFMLANIFGCEMSIDRRQSEFFENFDKYLRRVHGVGPMEKGKYLLIPLTCNNCVKPYLQFASKKSFYFGLIPILCGRNDSKSILEFTQSLQEVHDDLLFDESSKYLKYELGISSNKPVIFLYDEFGKPEEFIELSEVSSENELIALLKKHGGE